MSLNQYPARIVLFGNSNIDSSALEAHPEWEILNRIVSGERAETTVTRFQSSVLDERPDVVIVVMNRSDTSLATKQHLRSMYDGARKSGMLVIAAGLVVDDSDGPEGIVAGQVIDAWIEGFCEGHRRMAFCSGSSSSDLTKVLYEVLHQHGGGGVRRTPLIVEPGGGRHIQLADRHAYFKCVTGETDGNYAALEVLIPGQGPGPHIHLHHEEAFYVLEGQVKFQAGESVTLHGPGTFVYIPRGLTHTFWNGEESPAKMLIILSPGGFEQFFVDAASPDWGDTPFLDRAISLADKYSMTVL